MDLLISVIIPVFNRYNELLLAVQSVLSQTYSNLELLVIDDGSYIPVETILKELRDPRLNIHRLNLNNGVSKARNIGIKKAKGIYITFLDSDDIWMKNKLEMQVGLAKTTKTRFIHTNEIWIRNNSRVNQGKRHQKEGGDIFIRSLELCLISPSTVMIHSSIFEEYGYFREDFPVCEDYDLWLRICAFEKIEFIEIPLIYKYGGHKDQLSAKYHSMDHYRVLSLMSLFHLTKLNAEKKTAVINCATRKLNILIQGAKKRLKDNDVIFYQSLLRELDGH